MTTAQTLALPLPCIICLKELESAVPIAGDATPFGTKFTSGGHYGSMFDEMSGRWIEINICDECLTERAGKGLVAVAQVHRPVYRERIERERWTAQ